MGWTDTWIGLGWVGSGQKKCKDSWVGSDWVKFLVGQVGLGPDLVGHNGACM